MMYQLWNFKATTAVRSNLSLKGTARPLLLALPLIVLDSIIRVVVGRYEYLPPSLIELNKDLITITLLMIIITLLFQPHRSSSDKFYLHYGKRCYSWNILTAFIMSTKTTLLVVVLYTYKWLGY